MRIGYERAACLYDMVRCCCCCFAQLACSSSALHSLHGNNKYKQYAKGVYVCAARGVSAKYSKVSVLNCLRPCKINSTIINLNSYFALFSFIIAQVANCLHKPI